MKTTTIYWSARLGVLLFTALFAAGCASLPASPTKMSPSQLKEWIKIKDANVVCVVVNSPWGKQSALYLNLDKGVVTSGTVLVEDGCKTTITNTTPATGGK